MNLKKKSVIFKKKKKREGKDPKLKNFPLKISLPLSMQVCLAKRFNLFFLLLLLKFN